MKTKQIILVLMASMFAVMPVLAQKANSNRETVVFCVNDMDCQSCKIKIEKNIAFEKGVKALDVNLENRTVAVTYDTRKNNPESLKDAFQKIGYEATTSSKPACQTPCADPKCAGEHAH